MFEEIINLEYTQIKEWIMRLCKDKSIYKICWENVHLVRKPPEKECLYSRYLISNNLVFWNKYLPRMGNLLNDRHGIHVHEASSIYGKNRQVAVQKKKTELEIKCVIKKDNVN